jgi:polysaccharide export outer membrane protein
MKCIAISVMAITVAYSVSAQAQASPYRAGAGAGSFSEGTNLPVEKIGKDDLLGIVVYDAPELSHSVRVGSDGEIRLPMLRRPILAAGLNPADLEASIAKALTEENVMVAPVVTVSVVESRSKPISVSGAVKNPVTLQAIGTVTLLDAISRAGGLSENAGAEILVSKPTSAAGDKPVTLIQRIPVSGLMGGVDTTLNLRLEGGEDIRVPEAGRVFVLGRVKKPGTFFITDGSESSVMKALALSGGLDSFPSHSAYIYRVEGGSEGRNEIPIELKKIMNRKAPDVALLANDILYVPDATGTRASMKVLESSLGVASVLGAALIYVH